MRELHKWKDKVELSLDNRQIFFLFFGLSIIGCFVFALGVLVGKRIESDGVEPQPMSSSSLALLDAGAPSNVERQPLPPLPELAFKTGLNEPAMADIPPTREPSMPPRPEETLRNQHEAKDGLVLGKTASANAKGGRSVTKPARNGAATRSSDAGKTAQVLPVQPSKPTANPPVATAKSSPSPVDAAKSVMASTSGTTSQPPVAGKHGYTLQMKAFSSVQEAEKLADRLRHNGHDVRIDAHEVRGRIWHRVRLGHYPTWEQAVAAKREFERTEHLIAYVVGG